MKYLHYKNGSKRPQRNYFDDLDDRDQFYGEDLDSFINLRNKIIDARDLEQDFNSYEIELLER